MRKAMADTRKLMHDGEVSERLSDEALTANSEIRGKIRKLFADTDTSQNNFFVERDLRGLFVLLHEQTEPLLALADEEEELERIYHLRYVFHWSVKSKLIQEDNEDRQVLQAGMAELLLRRPRKFNTEEVAKLSELIDGAIEKAQGGL